MLKKNNNKKVLLREHKRHTARRVASPWGGTYLGWGVPTLARGGTYLGWGDTYLGWGVPTLARGTPLGRDGVPTGCELTNKLKLPILRMWAAKRQ